MFHQYASPALGEATESVGAATYYSRNSRRILIPLDRGILRQKCFAEDALESKKPD